MGKVKGRYIWVEWWYSSCLPARPRPSTTCTTQMRSRQSASSVFALVLTWIVYWARYRPIPRDCEEGEIVVAKSHCILVNEDQSRFSGMGRLRLGIVLAGLVVAAVTFIPSVAGAASVTFGVPGLQLCGSTPSRCDLGPIREHFIDYGNVCSDDDCFFVSAADWEKVAAGVTPSLTTLNVDYKADGQTFAGGLSAPDLWAYWKSSGIDGVYLSSETTISKSEASVENAVKAHRAVIAQDVITSSSFLGPTKVRAGTAIMIAVGYTPKGPLVVYQAKTIQMTWAQWNTQIRSVWELVVSKTAPQGTTTTTPPPTSTPNPTATLALSSDSLTSAGGTCDPHVLIGERDVLHADLITGDMDDREPRRSPAMGPMWTPLRHRLPRRNGHSRSPRAIPRANR